MPLATTLIFISGHCGILNMKASDPIKIPDLADVAFKVEGGIVLRSFNINEASKVFKTVKANTERLLKYMHWMTLDYSLKMAEEFVERSRANARKGESLSLGIFQEERLIGVIGFVGFDTIVRKTEIGYWIDGDWEGKGIISNGVRLLIDFAFNELSMNRIEIRCSATNVRSAAVPKRMGFLQ